MPDNLRLQVLVEVDAETGELKIVEQGLEGVRHETDRATRSTERNTRATGQQQRQMKSLRSELAGVAAAAAGLYGVLRAGQAVIRNTALFEQFELRLNVFAASAEEGARNYRELLDYAARTPFALQGVIDSYLLLEATSFEPRLDELRSLGDIAAATARPLEELGQAIAAAGRNEFDPLEGFGFTIRKENERVRIEFRDTVKEVEDSRRAILTAIVDIARERDEFAGATEVLAASLTGALSNLGDSFQQFLVEVGRGGLADAVSDWARALSAAADNGAAVARALGAIAGAGVRVAPVAAALGAIYLQGRLLSVLLPALNTGLAATQGRLLGLATAGRAVRTVLGGWPGLLLLAGEAAFLFGSRMAGAGEDASDLQQRIDAVTGSIRDNIDAYEEARSRRAGRDDPFVLESGRNARGQQTATLNPSALPRLLREFFTQSDDELGESAFAPAQLRLSERLRADIDALFDQLTEQRARLQDGLEAGLDTSALREDFEVTRRALTDLVADYEALLARIAEGEFQGDPVYREQAAEQLAGVPVLRGQVAGASGTPAVPDTLAFDSEAFQAAIAEIDAAELELMSDFDRAVANIRAEAQRLRDSLAEAGADAPGYADQLARINVLETEGIRRLQAEQEASRRAALDAAGDVLVADLETFQLELREQAAAQHAQLQDAISQIAEAGGDGLDGARRAAVEWESEMLAILAQSPAAWAQWADTVAGITEERLREINEQAAGATAPPEPDTWLDGIEVGLQRYQDLAEDAAGNAENAIARSFQSMENALVEFVTTGELNIRSLVDSIISEFARLVIRQAILGPLTQALGGALGGLFPGATTGIGAGVPGGLPSIAGAPFLGVGHTGAVVPHWPEYRVVDPALLAGARRYHSGHGLAPGESLGIFEAGEIILSRDQVAALRNTDAAPGPPPEVQLNFENRGSPVEPTLNRQRWDGNRLVVDVVLEDIARRGPLSQGLQRTFGLREQNV